MCDRMLRTKLWSQTCVHTLTDKIITQTIFVAWFTSGLFPHMGKTPGWLIWHLPKVFVCNWLSVDQFLSLQDMSDPDFFSRALVSGGGLSVALGVSWYLPTIRSIKCCLYNPVRVLFPHQSKGLGWPGKIPKWHHLSPGSNWRVHGGGQSIWPFYNVGKPLSGQDLHCGGTGQTTGSTDPHLAQLTICLSAAQCRHLP